MKNKDLKKILKQKASQVEIKDYTNEILNRVDHTKAVVEPVRRKKSIWTYSLSLALATIVVIAALLFILPDRKIKPIDGPLTISKKEEVLSREVIALGNIVSDIDTDNTLSLMSYSFNTDEIDLIICELNEYLYTTNIFMMKNDIEVEYELNDNLEYSQYKYRMNISFEDSIGIKGSYLVYYNEEAKDNNKEIEIDGIIIIDDVERRLEGEREDDGDEVELELKVMTGDSSYISIKNETEINENEYKYTFVRNGVVVKGVEMEVENEDGVKETSIEITENGKVKSYEFTYLDDYVEAEYKDDSGELELLIYTYNDYYLYKVEESDYEKRINR